MEASEDKAAKCQVCIGGWAFLLVGGSIICLVPTSVCMAYFATRPEEAVGQIMAVVFFAVFLSFLTLGIIFTIVWCRQTDYNSKEAYLAKQEDKKSDDKDKKDKDKDKDPEKNANKAESSKGNYGSKD